jgi:hypothetical protein
MGFLRTLLLVAWCVQVTIAGTVSGTIMLDSKMSLQFPFIFVQMWELHSFQGQINALSKRCVFQADNNSPLKTTQAALSQASAQDSVFEFRFDNASNANVTLVAFAMPSSTLRLNFSGFQPLGWLSSDNCLGGSGAICADVVSLTGEDVAGLRIVLNFTTPASEGEWNGSKVTRRNGIVTARLIGNATERGYAHGRLLGRQVLDMFEYFLLEDRIRSRHLYEVQVRPGFMSNRFNLSLHPLLLVEASALADGVCASMDCATSLGRPLDAWDIVALNGYGVWAATLKATSGLSSGGRACSQFILWGDATVAGQTIHGRNMDGEIDVRKLTVSAFTLFAIAPTDPGAARIVSAMWPGFIGTYRYPDVVAPADWQWGERERMGDDGQHRLRKSIAATRGESHRHGCDSRLPDVRRPCP